MQFTYLAVFFCAVWTLVSALPLSPLGSELTPRGSDERIRYRSLYARGGPVRTPKQKLKTGMDAVLATTKKKEPIPYQVSLKQSKPGTADEHWGLHVHPQQAGKGDLHVLHAVSDDKKNGVLQVEHQNKGTYNPPAGSTNHPIAQFSSQSKALAAMRDVKNNVKLDQQFPHENCVDFTCKAVKHMADNGHIPQANHDTFKQHYDAQKDAVRANTNTETNRKKAGVPSTPSR